MANNEEKRGIMVNPLDWAKKNPSKLKTIRIENTNVTPKMMIRDKKESVIKIIQENTIKKIELDVKYKEYVLFHRLCYSLNLSPKKFIEKLTHKFEVEDKELINWLTSLKEERENSTLEDEIYLTEDELYKMLEKL